MDFLIDIQDEWDCMENYIKGDYEKVVPRLNVLLDKANTNLQKSRIYYQLGNISVQKGEASKAEEYFRKTIAFGNANPEVDKAREWMQINKR